MTVYCVMFNDWEGQFLSSIWNTEEAAQAEADRRNAELPDEVRKRRIPEYSVEPNAVREA